MESRCGIECSQCNEYKSSFCVGCLKTEKQFWGECPIKTCCLSKAILYCGQCREFPCGLLNQFAFDEDQGDQGKRIENCRCWKINENK